MDQYFYRICHTVHTHNLPCIHPHPCTHTKCTNNIYKHKHSTLTSIYILYTYAYANTSLGSPTVEHYSLRTNIPEGVVTAICTIVPFTMAIEKIHRAMLVTWFSPIVHRGRVQGQRITESTDYWTLQRLPLTLWISLKTQAQKVTSGWSQGPGDKAVVLENSGANNRSHLYEICCYIFLLLTNCQSPSPT